MSLPNLFSPSATFEAPLEMLAACHGRIERQGETLRRLVPHVAANGSDQPAREAAQAVLRYFDRAALDHHADEEQDLFPALLEAMAGSDAVCLRELTEQLTQQHLPNGWTRTCRRWSNAWWATTSSTCNVRTTNCCRWPPG